MDRVLEKAAFLRRQAQRVKAIAANRIPDGALAASLARDFELRATELETEAKALTEEFDEAVRLCRTECA